MPGTKQVSKNVLGQYMKAKREAMGYSQKYVADKLGFSNSQFVSNWERGESSPPLKHMKKLVKLLHLNGEEVIKIATLEYEQMLRSIVGIRPRNR